MYSAIGFWFEREKKSAVLSREGLESDRAVSNAKPNRKKPKKITENNQKKTKKNQKNQKNQKKKKTKKKKTKKTL